MVAWCHGHLLLIKCHLWPRISQIEKFPISWQPLLSLLIALLRTSMIFTRLLCIGGYNLWILYVRYPLHNLGTNERALKSVKPLRKFFLRHRSGIFTGGTLEIQHDCNCLFGNKSRPFFGMVSAIQCGGSFFAAALSARVSEVFAVVFFSTRSRHFCCHGLISVVYTPLSCASAPMSTTDACGSQDRLVFLSTSIPTKHRWVWEVITNTLALSSVFGVIVVYNSIR